MGYGDARVRGNLERWKPPRRDEPSNSLPLSVFTILSSSCPLHLFSFLFFFSVSLYLSLPFVPSFSFPFYIPYPYLQLL